MISNSDEITKDPPEKEIKFILELINLNKIVDAENDLKKKNAHISKFVYFV